MIDSLINGATAISEITSGGEIRSVSQSNQLQLFIKNSGTNTAEVKIFNGEGKLIEEMKFEKEAEIKDLNSGFYFVEFDI